MTSNRKRLTKRKYVRRKEEADRRARQQAALEVVQNVLCQGNNYLPNMNVPSSSDSGVDAVSNMAPTDVEVVDSATLISDLKNHLKNIKKEDRREKSKQKEEGKQTSTAGYID